MKIILEKKLPTVDEYKSLRKSVGWPVPSDTLIEKGLKNSLFGICAFAEGQIVGMGRIVGDGAIYFHVQDIIVHSEFQRMKIGEQIMNKLMEWISTQSGQFTNIGLMCSKGREKFYEQFGFVRRPSEKFGAGMIKILE